MFLYAFVKEDAGQFIRLESYFKELLKQSKASVGIDSVLHEYHSAAIDKAYKRKMLMDSVPGEAANTLFKIWKSSNCTGICLEGMAIDSTIGWINDGSHEITVVIETPLTEKENILYLLHDDHFKSNNV